MNSANWFPTFLAVNAVRLVEYIRAIRVFFGGDELKIRRFELELVKPSVVKGCKREIKDMGNYKLYIFTPDVVLTNGAVIYVHGGGFACMTVGPGQHFCMILSIQKF